MRIGELAKRVGVPVATIRYYEQQGLIEKPARSESNYRRYAPEASKQLDFIRQCRSLDISLTETRRLIKLAEAPNDNCDEVDVLLDEHIGKVQEQRRNLAKLERELKALRADCHPSKQVRGCAILRDSELIPQGAARKSESKSSSPRP